MSCIFPQICNAEERICGEFDAQVVSASWAYGCDIRQAVRSRRFERTVSMLQSGELQTPQDELLNQCAKVVK